MAKHNQNRGACFSRGIQASSPSCRKTALCCHQRGCIIHITRSWRASVTASATCKPESRRNLKPTKPAVQFSDADRKRKIRITDKCTTTFKKWRGEGETFRVGAPKSGTSTTTANHCKGPVAINIQGNRHPHTHTLARTHACLHANRVVRGMVAHYMVARYMYMLTTTSVSL